MKREIPQEVPPNLYGKRKHDLTLRAANRLIGGLFAVARHAYRRDLKLPASDFRMPMVVRHRAVKAHDENVISLVLTAPDYAELPAWRPGAHLDLELPSGRLRQYSLCGDPADSTSYRIAVRRIPDGGGGSIEVHDALPVGTQLYVRGPRNAFAFAAPGYGSPADKLHFVAAGIGITPILPMARLAHRLSLDWSMVYTGRTRDSIPFLDEIAEFGDRVHIRTDDEDGLPEAKHLLDGITERTAIYCCGPTPMTTMLLEATNTMPHIEFHFERFSPAPIVDGVPFEVELASTGEVVDVPADRSALAAIRAVRPDIAYSCQQGFCRTCRVKVLKGTPQHRDTTLVDAERARGDMLICVSRSAGERLVLDI